MKKQAKQRVVIILVIAGIVLTSGLLIGPLMSIVEKPSYEVLTTEGKVEIRNYQPMLVASVEVEEKSREESIRLGFKLLADYIFGNNSEQQKISMTAPVKQKQINQSLWKVSFVMPSKYTLKSLPLPKNQQVQLQRVETKKFIVIRFSGVSSNKNLSKHEQRLLDYVAAKNISLSHSGNSFIYAFYNPPWTLPAMRRNEVMLELS